MCKFVRLPRRMWACCSFADLEHDEELESDDKLDYFWAKLAYKGVLALKLSLVLE